MYFYQKFQSKISSRIFLMKIFIKMSMVHIETIFAKIHVFGEREFYVVTLTIKMCIFIFQPIFIKNIFLMIRNAIFS